MKYPHPINCDSLYEEYYEYFKEPLEYGFNDDIDSFISHNKYIKKQENPLAIDYYKLSDFYDIENNENFYNKKHYVLKINHIMEFLTNLSTKGKTFMLIRDKINKHMGEYHPEGIKKDQIKNMFKYFIGIDFDNLDTQLQNDINGELFDIFNLDGAAHLVMKGKCIPKLPLSKPWTV